MTGKPDIVEILLHYGFDLPAHLNPNGHKIKCALHGDRQASAVVNIKRQYYVCFACGRRGDSWALIQEEEGLDFLGAKAFAAEQGWAEASGIGAQEPARPVRQRRGASGARARTRRRK